MVLLSFPYQKLNSIFSKSRIFLDESGGRLQSIREECTFLIILAENRRIGKVYESYNSKSFVFEGVLKL